jgi:hypothetical protein
MALRRDAAAVLRDRQPAAPEDLARGRLERA